MILPDLPFGWSDLATAGAGLGVGGLVKTWLDHKRHVRRASDEVAMSLVRQLAHRVETVEAAAAGERALCDAQLSALRCRVGGLSGLFDSLLLVAEVAPEHVRELAGRIRERREQQERAEAAMEAHAAAATAAAATAPTPAGKEPGE